MNIFVMNWVLDNVPNICAPDQPNHFTCPNATVFFNASIIWGVSSHCRTFWQIGDWPSTNLCTWHDLLWRPVVLSFGCPSSCPDIPVGEETSYPLVEICSHSAHHWRQEPQLDCADNRFGNDSTCHPNELHFLGYCEVHSSLVIALM